MRKAPSGLPSLNYRLTTLPNDTSGPGLAVGGGCRVPAFVGVSAVRLYVATLFIAGGIQAAIFDLFAGLADSIAKTLEEGFDGRRR